MKKKTKNKNRDAQKKRTSQTRGVSPEAGRESMVGKICDLSRRTFIERITQTPPMR